uniref:G_PROTEIN_RECEP_F2_3 domain-containing protein n=1 Tax=Angiostrongylus cantonensis TaxID=6313 RepID=A0A0K0D9Q1_ANGCA
MNSLLAVCPATWDGWQCFDSAVPGHVEGHCPAYIYGEAAIPDASQKSHKMCSDKGWVSRPSTNSEWTDYSGCTMVQQKAQVKLLAGIIAFSISVVCLTPAIFILWFFRPMRYQPMFIVHRHLLTSFLFSGLFYLFNCFFFIVDGAPGDRLIFANHISCRLLFLIQLRFLRLATFSWMLAEGVYLFRLLQSDSIDGDRLTIYKLLCWGLFPRH